MDVIREWFKRNLADPQVVILTAFLVVGVVSMLFFGRLLAPVLASVIIAYLLEGIVRPLERLRLKRIYAVLMVFGIFMAFLLVVILALLPMLSRQVVEVVQDFPTIVSWAQKELMQLPERYPDFVSREQVVSVVEMLRHELGRWGQRILSVSVASLKGLLSFIVYLILMPLLVFFFLKDKTAIMTWSSGLLPEDRELATQVWREVDRQIGNYIRGKFWEILIVWSGSAWVFHFLEMEFAMLLGFFVGLSVLIPYIGATVMTLPVALMGYFQFGWTQEFFYVVGAYMLIQLLDGNLLAPLLLSGVVNLHPVAIIVAVLAFGGLWGFWGIFFAIPLATLVQAVLQAWPRKPKEDATGEHHRPTMTAPA